MSTISQGPSLYEFLLEAELAHYFSSLKNELKVSSVAQLKYVEEDDLTQLGMTKPEQRRLRKYFKRHVPQTYLRKIRNIILSKTKDDFDRTSIYSVESTVDKSSIKVPNKHIIPFENISLNKQLGVGEFGVVQQGIWTSEDGERIQVAIKCLSEERMQKNHMEFLKEAAIMHSIDHEHIVRLYGVVLETNALMLVTELAPLRSLLECLKEPALRPSFPVLSLCDFAVQVCDGMQYLESKKLIHRDLAARNILVFGKNKVKISDFGLSRALGVGKDYYQTNFNVNLKLPIAWCAPECINYLRFTSASDVWAYGVTLWEMFSYGFQPWAALTGQQILEAIDEPNFQRLEQPECCPKEYFGLIEKCWQHDANKRPKFSEIFQKLPECKPEQVQALQDIVPVNSNGKSKKDWLQCQAGEIITVLDKNPASDNHGMWKGVLNSGKTGLFNPAQTIAYLGRNLPTTRPSFSKVDGKGTMYLSKRRLCSEMISRPQGDCKHTGHVGLDGAFFGDVSFLGDKYHQLPRQVVAPYKPQDDKENISPPLSAAPDSSDKTPLLMNSNSTENSKAGHAMENWPAVFSEKEPSTSTSVGINWGTKKTQGDATKSVFTDHEYHEISDDDDFGFTGNSKFDTLDFGPSLMDEVLMALGTSKTEIEAPEPKPEKTVKNEVMDGTSKLSKDGSKKKHAVVKPISASDQQTLDSAIAMAKELACKSMLDLESKSENDTPVESPKTPNSPFRRKFSFKFKTSPKVERRNFSEETEAIGNIQDIITEEAKDAYNSLVDKGQSSKTLSASSAKATHPAATNPNNVERHPIQLADSSDHETDISDASPLRMLKAGVPVRPKFRGNKHGQLGSGRAAAPHTATVARLAANASSCISSFANQQTHAPPVFSGRNSKTDSISEKCADGIDSKSDASSDSLSNTYNSSESSSTASSNPLPLPPRDRTKPMPVLKHHQRKHPLLLPNSTSASDISRQLTKQMSCPDVPSQSNTMFQIERRCSESGPPGFCLDSKPVIHGDVQSSKYILDSCDSTPSLPMPPPKPARVFNVEESLDMRIHAELESLGMAPDAKSQAMYKGGDHVSCEDLLEFALDKPNIRRTQGRARGMDSDEVRIMQKVLVNEQLTPEKCLLALNETDWDVHKAIKYAKLQCIIETNGISAGGIKEALINSNWDVRQAADILTSSQNTKPVTEI